MPMIGGVELARIVRSRFSRVAIVFMSGEPIPEDAAGLAHAILRKPFTLAGLVESIGSASGATGRGQERL
jgi:CheY-like chemotaxis protein